MTFHSLRLAFTDLGTITRRAFVGFGNHECAQRSAALAYYAMFSMFPLLLLSISFIGFLLEAGVPVAVDAQTAVLQGVEQTLPQAMNLVEGIITTTRRARGGTGLVGLIVLAWSASNIFTHARLALNAIWETGLPQGIGGVLRLRLNALGMVIGTGLLLIVSTVATTSLEVAAKYASRLPFSDTLWPLALPVILAGMTVLVFGFLYRFVPRAPLRWADVWPGAIVGGTSWEVLKKAFVWYATSAADWGAIYGPVAGVIALLLWLYLSAQVFLYGAEFAAAYSQLLREKHLPVPSPVETAPIIEQVQPSPGESFDQPETVYRTATVPPLPGPLPLAEKPKRLKLPLGSLAKLIGIGGVGALTFLGLLASAWRFLTRRKVDPS